MEIILYILLGMIAVAVCVYLFHLLRLIITVLAWLLAAYLCFWGDNVLGGCLVLGIWYVFHCIMEGVVRVFGEPQDNALKENKETGESFFSSAKPASPRRRKQASSSVNWNFILMCLIPLFWPVLIFKTFFGGKQAGELNEYDYEQHLKCNKK